MTPPPLFFLLLSHLAKTNTMTQCPCSLVLFTNWSAILPQPLECRHRPPPLHLPPAWWRHGGGEEGARECNVFHPHGCHRTTNNFNNTAACRGGGAGFNDCGFLPPPPPKQDWYGDRAMRQKVNPPFCAVWLSVHVGWASGCVFTWLIRVVQRRIQPSRPSRWIPVRVGHATPCHHPSREERGSAPRCSIMQRRCCCNPGRPPPPLCRGGEEMRRGAYPEAWTCKWRWCGKPIIQLSWARPSSPSTQARQVESSPLTWARWVKPVELSPLSWARSLNRATVRLKARDFKLLKIFFTVK